MTNKMTITEALAEIKLIKNKIDSKRNFITPYLTRPSDKIDPMADRGGSPAYIKGELQAIHDLEKRIVAIRDAIAKSNQTVQLEISGTKLNMTVSEWLFWRREVYPARVRFLQGIFNAIQSNRTRAHDTTRLYAGQTEVSGSNIIVHIDEMWLQEELVALNEIENKLDGQLSLLNARTEIEV